MDKVCVVGCLELNPKTVGIDGTVMMWELGGASIKEGVTQVTIEGTTGKVWVDVTIPVIGAENNPAVASLNSWVSEVANFTEKVTGGTSGYLMTHTFDNDTDALKETLANFSGIVSLNTNKDNMPEWDSFLFELVTPFDETKIKQDKIAALSEVKVSNVLIDLDNHKLTSPTKARLEKNGYAFINTISNLEGIVMTKGIVKFSADFVQSAAVEKVLKMKQTCGEEIKQLVIIDSFDASKNYSDVHLVASKEVVMRSLLK
jgi:hypothetical protein